MKAQIPVSHDEVVNLIIEGFRARGFTCTGVSLHMHQPDRPGDTASFSATAEVEVLPQPTEVKKTRGRPRKALDTLPPAAITDTSIINDGEPVRLPVEEIPPSI